MGWRPPGDGLLPSEKKPGVVNYLMMETRRIRLYVALSLLGLAALWLLSLAGTAAAPPGQGAEVAVISQPPSNAVVSGVVQIQGSADHPSFNFYVVDLAPEPISGDQWSTVGQTHETPVVNGVLETWDTTQVPDGSYTLRLRVVRIDGNYSEHFTQQVVVSNSQPTPTPTLDATPTPSTPTTTPTPLPPTPTIVIEQPVVDTPTPRPVATTPPLEDPDENDSFIPTVTGFSTGPLRDACCYGVGITLSIFVLFGFLVALRTFAKGLLERMQGR